MTAADKIFAHITANGSATRPAMEKKFDLCEKTVDAAFRKLERLGYIKRDGLTPKIRHRKSAVIFVLASAEPDLKLIADTRGRPSVKATKAGPTFDALGAAMNALFQRRVA
ncbi:hypothetical protein [Paraburkholderia sp.]|uniref:hypothetical protein n=1 Tax=Paraburkholderia sp. TaxID=1926495 RepID=UPI00239627D9|nr:hypothetical protein [Paraburkholderia sp.]MDE1179477.1 hypothetical protein [Paraburkholderia sp.]